MVPEPPSKPTDELALASERVDRLVVPGRTGAGFAAGTVLAFLAAVVLGGAVQHRLLRELPVASADQMREGEESIPDTKRAWFREYGGGVDVVFLGSSRVYRQVDPLAFEQLASEAGHAWQAFDFGVPGMNLLETLALLDWILDRRPGELEWVVVELQPLDPPYLETNAWTARQIAWHTPAVTRAAVEVVLASGRPLGERLELAGFHGVHLLLELASAGRGYALVERLREGPPRLPRRGRFTGYLPMDLEASVRPDLLRKHERFLRQAEQLEGRRERLLREPAVEELDDARAAVLERVVARAAEAGVGLVWVLYPPTWERQGEYLSDRARSILGRVLAYNDPERYPELYALENLYGFDHLNQRGAELFTRLLSADLLRRFEESR